MLKPIRITQQAPPMPAIKAGCFTTSVICSVMLLLFSVMTTSLRPPREETTVLVNVNATEYTWCSKGTGMERFFESKQHWLCPEPTTIIDKHIFLSYRKRIKLWVWNVIKNIAPFCLGLLIWIDSEQLLDILRLYTEGCIPIQYTELLFWLY